MSNGELRAYAKVQRQVRKDMHLLEQIFQNVWRRDIHKWWTRRDKIKKELMVHAK